MMNSGKWPKVFPALTPEQQRISDDFMHHWHEVLAGNKRYGAIEKFNHGYPVKNSRPDFLTTLEIGAGIGEHLAHETLTEAQQKNYVALELRENMANQIRRRCPQIQVATGDCQGGILFPDHHFDRILAIHVLEHLPDLPAAIKELHRVINKKGQFLVVIPCEGGLLYSLARKISAERVFEKRYHQPYKWFIEREHINLPAEIMTELKRYFNIVKKSYFPFMFPSINGNLCIGITLQPK